MFSVQKCRGNEDQRRAISLSDRFVPTRNNIARVGRREEDEKGNTESWLIRERMGWSDVLGIRQSVRLRRGATRGTRSDCRVRQVTCVYTYNTVCNCSPQLCNVTSRRSPLWHRLKTSGR